MTIRSRIADFLLADQKAKLQQAAVILQEAYYRGPMLMSPEVLLARLAEVDSRYIDLVARQLQQGQGGLSGLNYVATETDRLRTVDLSRRQYDADVLTEAIIDIWTDFGYGVSLEVAPRDPAAREVWDAFFTSPANSYVFSQRDIQRLSKDVLTDGDFLFVFFISTLDGETTVRTVPTHELAGGPQGNGVITLPDDRRVPVLYRRQVGPVQSAQGAGAYGTGVQETSQRQVLYYRDWRATDAMVERVMPRDPRDPSGPALDRFEDGPLADHVREDTQVVAMLVAHRARQLRGWPLMTTGLPWSSAYKDFLQDRASVAKAAAMYFDKIRAKGGQRAIDHIVSSLQSSLAGSGAGYETNPVPAAGSTWVENEQLERSRFPQGTGAGDAATDSAALMGQAGLAGRVYPHWLGRGEAFRLATATAMETPTQRAFNRYQLFWSSVWGDMARIVISAAERHGRKRLKASTYDVDVNTDALLTVDVTQVEIVAAIVTSLASGQFLDLEVAQQIVPHLLRVALQSLGVRNLDDLVPAPAPTEAGTATGDGQEDADLTEALLAEAQGGPDAYRAGLARAVRALWSGQVQGDDFASMMVSAIRRGLTDAWYQGAKDSGVAPEELTPEELVALQDAITTELGYIAGFGEAIQAGSKAAGGQLADFESRLDQWGRRWDELKTRARMMAAIDQKSIWVLRPGSQHCEDCPKLAGQVRRNSVWQAAGIYPRSSKLSCGPGCNCGLDATNEPATRGPLPRLAGKLMPVNGR